MKLPLLLLLCFQVSRSLQAEADNCKRSVFARCAERLFMLGDATFTFPVNMEQMLKRCKDIKIIDKCIKDYSTRCLKGETRNSVNVLVYGVAKTNKGYCSSPKRRNSFISIGPCVNENRKKLDKALADMNVQYHGARIYKDPKLRLPLACCNYYQTKLDILNALHGRHCTQPVKDEVENLVDGYARDGLNLLCGDYTEDSDKCSKIIAKTPKWTKALESNQFLLTFADLLDSL